MSTYVGAAVVVDGGLGHHAVVLELALAERRSVGGDEDELGFAGAEGLQCRLIADDARKASQKLYTLIKRKI